MLVYSYLMLNCASESSLAKFENRMQILGNLFTEKETRSAIFMRYDELPLLEQWQEHLNMGEHRCIVIK